MNRRAARRHVGAGAILALTIWMGGLPAAAADEPVPDTPTAAASAATAVGGDAATDVTPTPEPTPSSDATPSPEPSTPGPDPVPTGDQPTKGAEPAPVPRPAPTLGPHTTTSTQGHDADTPEAAPLVVIGEFDCEALSTTVSLDNRNASEATVFVVRATDVVPIWGMEGSWVVDWTVEVVAGAVKEVRVPLLDDATNWVVVSTQAGLTLASQAATCGNVISELHATIGTFDCASLEVPVTLDNSASTSSSYFTIFHDTTARDWDPEWEIYVVAGRALKVVDVPLSGKARSDIWVHSGPDDYGDRLAEARGPMCGLVKVSGVDCDTKAVTVSLTAPRGDGAPHNVTYLVSSTRYPAVSTAYSQTFLVAWGATKKVHVTVASLAGGDLRVEEVGATQATYEQAPVMTCSAGAGPSDGTVGEAAATATTSLAATGPAGLWQLLFGGWALITTGGLLILGSRSRKRPFGTRRAV